jgi:hypothetical protein
MLLVSRNRFQRIQEFTEWLDNAPNGDVYTYYTGPCVGSAGIEYESLARVVYGKALDGKVYLFQRKISPFTFDYIAVKSGKIPKQLMPIRG